MKYTCCVDAKETELSVEHNGLQFGGKFVDYADFVSMRPVNHRVIIGTEAGGGIREIEISMLGFSFDGFWEELTDLYGKRCLESLFVDEDQIMLCEGEYSVSTGSGCGIGARTGLAGSGCGIGARTGLAGSGRGIGVQTGLAGSGRGIGARTGLAGSGHGIGVQAVLPESGRGIGVQTGLAGSGHGIGAQAVLPESGRGEIALYPDSVCILTPDRNSVRIPLCYVTEIIEEGYLMTLRMRSGVDYTVGRMGYDTKPFFERTVRAAEITKKKRAKALRAVPLDPPFTAKGLFRTEKPEQYWNAAFGKGACAVELYTGDDAATYLYRFEESQELFTQRLEEAMEAVGVHREIIYLTDEQVMQKPLYRMSIDRTDAVRFLRSRSAGRIIHNAKHSQNLQDFLAGEPVNGANK